MKNKLTAIHRLELESFLLASKIKLTVTLEMDIHIDSIYLWSDSKTVSNYLHNINTKIRDLNIPDVLSHEILLENSDVFSLQVQILSSKNGKNMHRWNSF